LYSTGVGLILIVVALILAAEEHRCSVSPNDEHSADEIEHEKLKAQAVSHPDTNRSREWSSPYGVYLAPVLVAAGVMYALGGVLCRIGLALEAERRELESRESHQNKQNP
jgi:hypothetical protein